MSNTSPSGRQQGDTAALLGQQAGQGLRGGVIDQQPGHGRHLDAGGPPGGVDGVGQGRLGLIGAAFPAAVWSAAAFPATAWAWSAARSATLRAVPASKMAAALASTSSRSSSSSGPVTSRTTADLRLPGLMPTAVNRFSGSRQPGRTSTSASPPAAAARTLRTSMPARSGGVWVAVASAWT